MQLHTTAATAMKPIAAIFVWLLSMPVSAQIEMQKNEWLYENCKLYQRMKTESLSGLDLVKASNCLAYMDGALKMFELKSAKQCVPLNKSLRSFIDDYVVFVRMTGALDEDKSIVVLSFLEECYCNKGKKAPMLCPSYP